jgi:hypothetical protein
MLEVAHGVHDALMFMMFYGYILRFTILSHCLKDTKFWVSLVSLIFCVFFFQINSTQQVLELFAWEETF